MDWFKKRWTKKDAKELKKVRDKMEYMVREEILEIERLQSLGVMLMSQRETMQASLAIQREEMASEIRALEVLRQEKEEIKDSSNDLRKCIEVHREMYVAEKLALKEKWRKDLETLKLEEDELQARLKVEWDKSERLKKEIKQEINRVREEMEEEKENLRRAKETQMELLEKERVFLEVLETERNKKQAVMISAMAAVQSERRRFQDDFVCWENERMNMVNRRQEQRLKFEEEKQKMTIDIQRERDKIQAERQRLANKKQEIIQNWENEKVHLNENIAGIREQFLFGRKEMIRQQEKEIEYNKNVNQRMSVMMKEELERENNNMRIAHQITLDKLETANTVQKKSILNETMRLKEQFQKEIDGLHEEKKRTKAHWLKRRDEVEEDLEKEREMLTEEQFRLGNQLNKMRWEKDNKRIVREELVNIKVNSPEVVELSEQWEKYRAVKMKWWEMEKAVIEERKVKLEREILSYRKQWQEDRLSLKGEKKVAQQQKVKRWFLSLCCKK